MRDASTLIPEKLPPKAGCILEERLFLPDSSWLFTTGQFLLTIPITLGFSLFFEILIGNMSPVGPLPFVFVSAYAVCNQGVHFSRHWVYYSTAAPCHPQITYDIRTKIKFSAFRSMFSLPVTTIHRCLYLLLNLGDACRAWDCYLNYGRGALGAAGVFESPAGDAEERRNRFYVTAALASLSLWRLPFLQLAFESENNWFVLAVGLSPAFACIVVPMLILAPHLPGLRRCCGDNG